MKAALYYGPGNVKVEQIPEPEPKEGQIKVKIAWNGICGSDLHAYLMQLSMFPTADVPNDVTGDILPITLGHEFSGTIVGHGSGIDKDKWKIGQNVVIEPVISCLKKSCVQCIADIRNICPSCTFIGIGGWGGGLAEYIAVDTRYVHILPDGISLEVGAMIEPLAVAWYAVKKSGFKPGQTVLIVGGGPIGLLVLKVLRSIDSSSVVILSEPASGRRSLALKHGANSVVNPLTPSTDGLPSAETLHTAVLELTNGLGVDIAFDAAGIQASIDAALLNVRPRGTVVNVAIWEESPRINMNLITTREINMTATIAYTGIHPELLEVVRSGKIKGLEDLITKKISIDDVVEQGIMALLTEKDKQVKILVHP